MTTAAQQLSEWIEATHPDFFNTLYSYVANRRMVASAQRARLRGFGDDGGDDLSEFTPDFGDDLNTDSTDLISSQYSPATVDIPTLTSDDLGVSAADDSIGGGTSVLPSIDTSSPIATDNSGSTSFLSTVGSGIASAASSVGSFLTSAQGLTDVTKLATAYFQLQATNTNAAVQRQVLTAQVARAAVGQAPLPVTYAMASNGQLIPIYSGDPGAVGGLPVALQSAIGNGLSQYVTTPDGVSGYTVPSNIIGSLAGGAPTLSDMLPWIALIVGGLILANEMGK